MTRSLRIASVLFVSLALVPSSSHAAPPNPSPAGVARGAPAKPVDAPIVEVDLNTATKEELRRLPGVGEALAAKIVANRPYLSKAFLVTNKVVSEDVYLAIRSLVVARPLGAATGGREHARPSKR